ncbi:MAG TPA: DUF5668 domain-containing protein [Smithellaceae bacterium]|jgi:hypothetical protein|nr:DUF5668 domain-containing protein [Smithellaceae bacterium]
MSVHQAVDKNVGSLCCRPWIHHRHPALRKKIGIFMILIGLIWLGSRMGLLDFSWLPAVYFWPAVFILAGTCLVYRGFTKSKPRTIDKERKEV